MPSAPLCLTKLNSGPRCMGKMHIRPATKNDLPVIYKMMQDFATFLKVDHFFTLSQEEMGLVLFDENSPSTPFVGTTGNKIIAFANLQKSVSTFLGSRGLFIDDLYISPSYRGHGYGSQFFEFLINFANQHNYSYVYWGAYSNNTKALEFYKKIGAESDPMVEFVLRDDALKNFKKVA